MSVTFGMIKPDAVGSNKVGAIIECIEARGLTLVRLRMRELSLSNAAALYRVHRGKPFFGELIQFTATGRSVLMGISGPGAVGAYRRLVEETIRPIFGTDIRRNAAHASDSPESAAYELALFFPDLLAYPEEP